MLGFMGDVGDLAKLIQAAEGVRAIPDAEAKLAHELADCLWSAIVLADAYGIGLARAFVDTMDALEKTV
jgi:NTP pyrophosphatase (non-canonical NTP hydrolase)